MICNHFNQKLADRRSIHPHLSETWYIPDECVQRLNVWNTYLNTARPSRIYMEEDYFAAHYTFIPLQMKKDLHEWSLVDYMAMVFPGDSDFDVHFLADYALGSYPREAYKDSSDYYSTILESVSEADLEDHYERIPADTFHKKLTRTNVFHFVNHKGRCMQFQDTIIHALKQRQRC